ncbi:MAG TPA: hypothetical protein VFI47_01590 [Acidimicrobiales bacterium]|nr:hypothetical protein [Acidimicrobiales bacterium]
MPRPRTFPLTVALVALIGLAAACGGGDDEATVADGAAADSPPGTGLSAVADVEIQKLEITVPGGADGEYAYAATPQNLTAGPVEVSITNDGALEHQAMLMRFRDGADFAQFAAAAAADPTGISALALVEGFGGPNGAAPGQTRTTTQVLEPGDYMVMCLLPGEDGTIHAQHGMLMPFSVAPGDVEVDAGTPTGVDADHEVHLVEFGFGTEGTFAAGETLHIVNDGDQPHEFVAFRLDEGATVDDFTAAITNPSGPLPASAGTGTGALAPGRSVDLVLPDDPGDYVLFCMVPDIAGDGLPHIAHGMVAGATVR